MLAGCHQGQGSACWASKAWVCLEAGPMVQNALESLGGAVGGRKGIRQGSRPLNLHCIHSRRCIPGSEIMGVVFEPSGVFRPEPPQPGLFLGHSNDLCFNEMPWLLSRVSRKSNHGNMLLPSQETHTKHHFLVNISCLRISNG